MTNRSAVIGLVVLMVVMVGLLYVSRNAVAPTTSTSVPITQQDEALVRDQVANFGAQLKNVALLAPDAAQQITTSYASFVTPELLETWSASTTQAPGRLTSSPWPERIVIDSVTFQDGRYRVLGAVVEVTSGTQVGALASQYPVYIEFENRGGKWLISQWQKEPYTED